ncbi:uncharacterized protein LOC123559858 [Mercenaria mercenaria]|uniref:uncharacterized protein LOC123559858 n=1 Tax=Mercenaria mercenaria TaxID=6596 RepID=UPI00234E42DD|nr:uncharacterized protein LOC123559858 [Mercenaria mercenaria]
MDDDKLILPPIYNFTPLRALRVASRWKLSRFLDLEGVLVVLNNDGIDSDVVNDYSGLAELVGFNYQDIMNMKRQRSPTTELLDLWTGQNGNVGELWMYLYMMERYDVLTDCRRPIVHDCSEYETYQQLKLDAERHNTEQDPTVTTSEMRVDETKFATLEDVRDYLMYEAQQQQKLDTERINVEQDPTVQRRGKRTAYDAFICYTAEDENDRKFLYKIIEELEVKRGLKLFVPGRDDLPGSAEYTITAYLIEKRCRRVVILMSRKFLQSEACDFQVKFAHSLFPAGRSKKLIPVIREKNTQMPRILSILGVCDFTKPDMVEWVWNRLFATIIAPTGPTTYFEDGDPSNPFNISDESLRDIKYPSHCRLDEHEDSLNHLNEQSRTRKRPIDVCADSQPREPMEYDVSSMSWGQPTSNMQSQSPSSVKSSSLPPETKGKSSQKGATGSVKQSKPVLAKKPDKLKNKKQVSSQRQQLSTYSKTISSSVSTEHFVALRTTSRRKLSSFLDLEGVLVVVDNDGIDSDIVNDYSGLAELAGFNYQDIMDMKRQRSPTTELLDLWTGQNGNVDSIWFSEVVAILLFYVHSNIAVVCVNYIISAEIFITNFSSITSFDNVLMFANCYFVKKANILHYVIFISVQDCVKYEEQQKLKPGPLAPVRESKTFYDAFICYTAGDENDRQFLYKMIDELEVKRGLKLFVPGRDDLPGSAEYTITAYLVEKRCTRVVILTSRMFLQSAACDFQVKFAHALSPGARSKKLIPVIHEKNTQLPRILRFLPVCDFTKSEMVEWVWYRLFTAIIAPVGPTTYFEQGDPSNPFEMSDESLKDIKFPSHRRLDEHEDSSDQMHVQSRPGSRPIGVCAGTRPREPMEYNVSSMS